MGDDELQKIYDRCDVSNNRTDNPMGFDEFKTFISQQRTEAAIEEYKRHFIPHGTNQLETIYLLPDKKLSVWGTTDSRAAYDYRLAELQSSQGEGWR